MLSKKKILKYIGIVILIKIIAFTLFFLYSIEETKKEVQNKTMKINEIEVIKSPKKEVLSKAQKEEQKERAIQWKLEEKMKTVYKVCVDSHTKGKNKKEILTTMITQLTTLQNVDIFIANYHEKTVYGSNDYVDVNARTIVLEEIQKVRRSGGGFIVSDLDFKGKKRYILLKNLKQLDLYIGINFIQ